MYRVVCGVHFVLGTEHMLGWGQHIATRTGFEHPQVSWYVCYRIGSFMLSFHILLTTYDVRGSTEKAQHLLKSVNGLLQKVQKTELCALFGS